MTTIQSANPPVLSARTLNGRNLAVIVLAGSLISSIGLGVRSTFGLYLDPVIDSLGTDRGMYSLAIAIQNLMWGLSQPIAGAVADRFGSAKVLATGGVGYAIALLVMSTVESSGPFYLSAGFGVGIATGAASFSVVLAAVGRMTPPERAPMALGIVTAMGSVGQFVLVPVAQRLLTAFDWRTTVAIIAIVVLLISVVAPMVRGTARQQQGRSSEFEPEDGAGVDGSTASLGHELRRAAHSRSFLLLNAAFFVCGFHVTFIGTHLVSYAGDIGVSAGAATTGLAIIGLFNIVGSLTAGYLGSRLPKTYLLAAIYFLRAVVILVFLLVPASGATVVAFGAAIGVLWLSTVPLTGGIVNGLFGTTHAGTLFGIVFLSHQLGAFTGVWMGGELADRAGTYAPVWWIAVGLGVAAAVLHLGIDERPAAPPPARGSSPIGIAARPAGAAGAAVIALLVGTFALFQPTRVGADVDPGGASSDAAPVAVFCVLHPVDTG